MDALFPSLALSLLAGFALAALVAALAYLARSLTLGGALAAVLVGGLVFGLGGLPAAALLLTFFITSSLLSRLFRKRKAPLAEKFSKGSRRDAGQVLANGGMAALFAVAGGVFPGQAWPWVGIAGSLAAVNADTWATELGVTSRTAPRLITTGRAVERGASGGVSLAGTLAALAGAALIGLVAILAARGPLVPSLEGLAFFSLCGLAGSLVDSLLGATLQAIYYCPACQKETERHPLHSCGTPTRQIRGLPWLNNDWVNLACAASGAILAIVLLLILPGAFPVSGAPAALSPIGGTAMSFPISSTSFPAMGKIPPEFTCDGANRSPDLSWKDTPSGTRSLALIADDPDAPSGTFTHWVLYNIPPDVASLPQGLPKDVALPGIGAQGTNSFRRTGYDGPCPPPGKPHRYFFYVYALDIAPDLPPGLDAGQLRERLLKHVLAEAQWVGAYGR